MSCRVLGRGIETAFIARLVDDIRAGGGEQITARYLPTAKNVIVADLYPRHGFTDEGAGRFSATVSAVTAAPAHITFT
jgi:predicted enzyme involved in methoxymalonyl-ACP biosynthesis